jgi:HK97 family phage major capsid protein
MSDVIQVSKSDWDAAKTLIAQLKAQAEKNNKNVGTPGFLYGSNTDRSEKREQARHIGMFIKSVLTKDYAGLDRLQSENSEWYAQKANFNEATGVQGGHLVPIIWDEAISVVADQFGFARRLFRRYPMRSLSHYLHRGSTITGAFYSEGTPATAADSSNFFARTTLTAKRAAVAYIATEEELEDALPEFVAYMSRELGRGMAEIEDKTFFKGTTGGGDAFNGVLTETVSSGNVVYQGGSSSSGKDTWDEISWSDLIELQNSIKTGVIDNAIFVAPRSVYAALKKEKDSQLRPIWSNEMPASIVGHQGLESLQASVRWTPLGIPMVVVPDVIFPTEAVDTASVFYGDLGTYAYFGERKGMTTKTFNEYYNSTALSGANVAIEISERVGCAFPAPLAFGVLKTSAS